MIRLLRHDDLMEEFKAKFDGTSQWSIDAWITFLAKGRGPKKRFQYCLTSSKHFLYFRAIQGHSGGNLVDAALQDNVLLPDDFAKDIIHIANVSDFYIYSITRSGLIPGGRSLKKGQAIRVFHCSECDGRRSKYGRSSIRSGLRKVDNKINLIKKQENPLTTKAYREVTGKTTAATLTIESQAYLTLVQQQDTNRKETVKKMIQLFENHPNKGFFQQDLNKTEEIDAVNEKSKKLITDMDNTEIFELCETSSKKQCPD